MENALDSAMEEEQLMNFEEMVDKIQEMEKDEDRVVILSSQHFDRCATFNL